MGIEDYIIDDLLEDLKRIESDLQRGIISEDEWLKIEEEVKKWNIII